MGYTLVENSKDRNFFFYQIALKALYITKMAYNSENHKHNPPHFREPCDILSTI